MPPREPPAKAGTQSARTLTGLREALARALSRHSMSIVSDDFDSAEHCFRTGSFGSLGRWSEKEKRFSVAVQLSSFSLSAAQPNGHAPPSSSSSATTSSPSAFLAGALALYDPNGEDELFESLSESEKGFVKQCLVLPFMDSRRGVRRAGVGSIVLVAAMLRVSLEMPHVKYICVPALKDAVPFWLEQAACVELSTVRAGLSDDCVDLLRCFGRSNSAGMTLLALRVESYATKMGEAPFQQRLLERPATAVLRMGDARLMYAVGYEDMAEIQHWLGVAKASGSASPAAVLEPDGWSLVHQAACRGGTRSGLEPEEDAPRDFHENELALLQKPPPGSPLEAKVCEVVKILLDNGAPVDTPCTMSQTPIFWAANRNHASVAMMLHERGASLFHVDSNGQTALYYAAKNGSMRFARYYCEANPLHAPGRLRSRATQSSDNARRLRARYKDRGGRTAVFYSHGQHIADEEERAAHAAERREMSTYLSEQMDNGSASMRSAWSSTSNTSASAARAGRQLPANLAASAAASAGTKLNAYDYFSSGSTTPGGAPPSSRAPQPLKGRAAQSKSPVLSRVGKRARV